MHKTRSNRRANEARRRNDQKKHEPIPTEEQLRRAAERQADHKARYPHPPAYRYEMSGPQPEQPACYTVWYDPFMWFGRVGK